MTHGCSPPDSSVPTAVSCHSLLKGIFPTQGWNLGLLNYRQILYCLNTIPKLVLCYLFWKSLLLLSPNSLCNVNEPDPLIQGPGQNCTAVIWTFEHFVLPATKQNIGESYDWSLHRYNPILKDAQHNYEILETEQLDIVFIILVECKRLITNGVSGIICVISVGRSYIGGGAAIGMFFSGKQSFSLR